jgi:hypothetical protein
MMKKYQEAGVVVVKRRRSRVYSIDLLCNLGNTPAHSEVPVDLVLVVVGGNHKVYKEFVIPATVIWRIQS